MMRLHKRNRAYRTTTSHADQVLAIHAVRKAAKRIRYAAESAQPVFRKQAKLAARAKALQKSSASTRTAWLAAHPYA